MYNCPGNLLIFIISNQIKEKDHKICISFAFYIFVKISYITLNKSAQTLQFAHLRPKYITKLFSVLLQYLQKPISFINITGTSLFQDSNCCQEYWIEHSPIMWKIGSANLYCDQQKSLKQFVTNTCKSHGFSEITFLLGYIKYGMIKNPKYW